MYFEYEKNETDYLKSRDKLLGEAIDKIGHINRRVNKDIFSVTIDDKTVTLAIIEPFDLTSRHRKPPTSQALSIRAANLFPLK